MGIILCCQIVSCLIAAASFTYGAVHLLKKGVPLYQKIIMWGVGCFGLFVIASTFSTLVFDDPEYDINVSAVSLFGCLCALFSANFGAMDNVVTDDPKLNKFPTLIASIVSVVFAAIIAVLFVLWKDYQMYTAVCFTLAFLPMIPAVFYNVKHLLLPNDELGILKRNTGVNVLSIVFYFSLIAYSLMLRYVNIDLLVGGRYIVMSVIIFGITYYAKKGIIKW